MGLAAKSFNKRKKKNVYLSFYYRTRINKSDIIKNIIF